MFKKAYEVSSKFTFPLIVAIRFYDKTLEFGLGAFVIINDDGWIMTAAHNVLAPFVFNEHQEKIKDYTDKVERINSNNKLNEKQRKALARAIKPNMKWVTDFAIFLGGQLVKIEEFYIYPEHDIAFFRLEKKAISGITNFPKIINPDSISPGTSLLKVGYPFIEVKGSFNDETNAFELPRDIFPVPFYPIEGIYTRDVANGTTQDKSMNILFLETSSPGLKGQSGGPICDVEGNIYAIQSQNITISMGFKGAVKEAKKIIESDQFLNMGVGVHVRTIVELLKKHSIKFDIA